MPYLKLILTPGLRAIELREAVGSPVFNANGEVISIHRAGLPQAPGFALSVPIKHAIPLFPSTLRQKLGISF